MFNIILNNQNLSLIILNSLCDVVRFLSPYNVTYEDFSDFLSNFLDFVSFLIMIWNKDVLIILNKDRRSWLIILNISYLEL